MRFAHLLHIIIFMCGWLCGFLMCTSDTQTIYIFIVLFEEKKTHTLNLDARRSDVHKVFITIFASNLSFSLRRRERFAEDREPKAPPPKRNKCGVDCVVRDGNDSSGSDESNMSCIYICWYMYSLYKLWFMYSFPYVR